jgi:hypothetical protein
MIRHLIAATAAIVLTGTAVAALAETPTAKINAAGEFCVRTPAQTGSRIDRIECKSQAEWAKEGVTFSRR